MRMAKHMVVDTVKDIVIEMIGGVIDHVHENRSGHVMEWSW